MVKYYSIKKGTKEYDYLDKDFNKDTKTFLDEVSKLIGFEANGHIAINREKLVIKKSTLEVFKPEWLPKFKRYLDEWLTPKAELKDLISAYAELRKKYNMDYEFRWFCANHLLDGEVQIIYDFDGCEFAYLESSREVANTSFVEITEVRYLERQLELLTYRIEQKKKLAES
ncbi:hypothetical protein C2V94_13430 [Listeria monocytogenes]|nr:hypothetical protein [Listeria monocytogenes]